jgi:hypothetical protein
VKAMIVGIACALGLALTPIRAAATSISLALGDSQYVGSITDGTPSGERYELMYVANLLTVDSGSTADSLGGDQFYDRTLSTLQTLPGVDVFAYKTERPAGVGGTGRVTLTVPVDMTGTAYVLVKYGSKGAGDLVWLVHASGGDVLELPDSFNRRGISHISLFTTVRIPAAMSPVTPVPDRGVTLMLLGGSLVGLVLLRRAYRA